VKNNRLLHSVVEPEGSAPAAGGAVRLRFMIEWGWDRRANNEWECRLEVPGGKLLQAIPCFRGRVTNRVGRGITERSDSGCTWTSHTEQVQGAAPARRFGDATWLEVECPIDAPLQLAFACAGRRQQLSLTPCDILARSTLLHMEPVPVTDNGNYWAKMESLAKVRINQGWTTDQLTVSLRYEDDASNTPGAQPGQTDFYYARVMQRNGQRAWSSPIWLKG
jgi:hypothetical protein